MLDHAMAELETCRSGLPITEEGVVAEDIHGVLTARAGGVLRKHLHAQSVSEQGTVVEAVKGLLEGRDQNLEGPKVSGRVKDILL